MDVELAGLAAVDAGETAAAALVDRGRSSRIAGPTRETCPVLPSTCSSTARCRCLIALPWRPWCRDSTLSEPVRPALARLVTRRSQRCPAAPPVGSGSGFAGLMVGRRRRSRHSPAMTALPSLRWPTSTGGMPSSPVAPWIADRWPYPPLLEPAWRAPLPDPVSDETAAPQAHDTGTIGTVRTNGGAHVCAVVALHRSRHLGNGPTGRTRMSVPSSSIRAPAGPGCQAIDLGMRPGDRPHPGSAGVVRPRPAALWWPQVMSASAQPRLVGRQPSLAVGCPG